MALLSYAHTHINNLNRKEIPQKKHGYGKKEEFTGIMKILK